MFMHTDTHSLRHPPPPYPSPSPQHNETDTDAGKLDPQRGGAGRELGRGVSRRETSAVWVWVCQISPS